MANEGLAALTERLGGIEATSVLRKGAGRLGAHGAILRETGAIGSLDAREFIARLELVSIGVYSHRIDTNRGVLKEIRFELFVFTVLLIPFGHTVGGRFLLESLQDSLILNGDFNKFLLSLVSIQTADLKSLYTNITSLPLHVTH